MKSALATILLRSGTSLLCIAAAAVPAYAQATETAAPPSAVPPGDIVVTGTRLTNFAAPTPVTAITKQDLDAKAARTVTDLMADIPALRYNQNSGQVSAPIGASNLDLRALGPARTLLLVDGRRFAATDPSGLVDVNVIPAVLINKIEIVTGGASAAYGSDAVSGVVNITLETKLDGIKGNVQYGETTYGDHRQPAASLAVGKSFLDGRFHVLAAGDYFHNSGQLDQSTRKWGSQNYAVLTNPAYTATNGQPQRLILPGSTTSQLTDGGVISIATGNAIPALKGLQFGPGGTVIPFTYGTNLGASFMTGGSGATPMLGANITPRYTRYTGFGKASFDVTDTTTIYADILWSRSKAFADQLPNPDAGTLVIKRDNFYLPAAIRALIPANGTISIGRINNEDGVFNTQTIATTRRYGFGIDGGFGANWKWSASAQLSRNSYARDDNHNRVAQRFLNAVDAVAGPNGSAVCRINADAISTNDDPACVPANVFGAGSISQASVAYYAGTSSSRASQHQDYYSVGLSGSPLALPAGEVRVAAGGEYRKESVVQTSDPISQAGGWRQINTQALSGSYNVKEAYAEVGLPLLKDSPLGRNLDIDGAVRFTDYSNSGSVTTWKVGANYTPVTGLRFRGTVSRDIRAPNVNELYSGQAQGIPIIIDPVTTRSAATTVLTGGNPALTPEKARTYTAGIILEPSFMPRFHLSVDYYRVSMKNAIISLQGQQVVDGCYTLGQTGLCSAITRDAGNNITRIQATFLNAAVLKTDGVDIEAAYSYPLGNGTLNARLLANYVGKLFNSSIGQLAGTTGQTSGIPHWRGNIRIAYTTSKYGVGALVRYVEGGLFNNLYFEGGGLNSINNNHLGSRVYLDLDARFKLVDRIELFAKINNVFDRDPPIAPQVITQAAATGTYLYDRIGRYISGGVRFAF